MSDLLIPALVVLLLVAFAAGGVLALAYKRQGVTLPRPPAADEPAPFIWHAATERSVDAVFAELLAAPRAKPDAPKLRKRDAALREELRDDPTHLGYAVLMQQQDYEGIADLLNATPLLPNPQPQGTTPRRLQLAALVKQMKPTEALEFYKVGKLVEHVEQNLEPGRRARLIDLLNLCAPFLSAATVTKLDALLNETVPDADWPAQVAGASRAMVIGWPPVTPSDVQRVLA